MTIATKLEQGACKYTGKHFWIIEYRDKKGREMRTSPTTWKDEALAWRDIIERFGHCISAKAGPI